jgi:ubiquinone/menaquinone biosynthesis C-methylase UbiE
MISDTIPSNKDIWNSIASSFDTTRKKPWEQVITFLKTLGPINILADLGCGNGRHLPACSNISSKVLAIDISINLLSIAKQQMYKKFISNVAFLDATLTHLPIRSDSIDAAIYIASLHTLQTREQRIQSIKELHRILRTGKKALISVWSRDQERFKHIIQNNDTSIHHTEQGDIIVRWKQHNLDIPRFYHLYTKHELIRELTEGGFQIIEVKDAMIASKASVDNYFASVIKQ